MARLISSLFDQSTQRFKDDFDFLKELASGLTGLPYCFSFAISLIFFFLLLLLFFALFCVLGVCFALVLVSLCWGLSGSLT